jgi:hypothetical protein
MNANTILSFNNSFYRNHYHLLFEMSSLNNAGFSFNDPNVQTSVNYNTQ